MTTSPVDSQPRSSFRAQVRRLLSTADAMRSGARREGDELRPLGKKARRTRAQLLQAAYECFVENGYRATSVQDIHQKAGVSLGTFYQYFHDKGAVLATLVAEAIIEQAGDLFPPLDLDSERHGPRNAVAHFVRSYAANAEFQRVWEEVTHIEEPVARFRWDVSALVEQSLQASIEAGQASGTVAADLDPRGTARALGAMVDHHCYRTFVVDGRRDGEAVEHTVDVLTLAWERVLRP